MKSAHGHSELSPSQVASLAVMKEMLVKNGFLVEGTDDTEQSVEDGTILRFLRARKFDPQAGYDQFTSTATWRKDDKIDEMYDHFDVEEFEETALMYPRFTGRHDKNGLPLYVYSISSLTKDLVGRYSKVSDEQLQNRMTALYDHMLMFSLPFAGTHVHSTVTIVDVSNVSLSRFWALRPHMQRASVFASQRYAETLGRIYIVGAPSIFPIVWGWIKNWFDPGTVDKIFILSDSDRFKTLSRFIDVENIPKMYGGELDFTFSDRPILDDAGKDILRMDYLPPGPLRYLQKEGLVLKGTGRSQKDIDDYNARPARDLKVVEATEAESSFPVVVNGAPTEKLEQEASIEVKGVPAEKRDDVTVTVVSEAMAATSI